jgi:hypothetical protein
MCRLLVPNCIRRTPTPTYWIFIDPVEHLKMTVAGGLQAFEFASMRSAFGVAAVSDNCTSGEAE